MEEEVVVVASSLGRDRVVDTPVGEEEVVEDHHPHNELLVVA